MKKFFSLLLACLPLFFNTPLLAQGDTIRFGVMHSYPPFVSQNALGQSYGFDIAIAQAVCQKTNKKCVFIPMPFFDLFPALDKNTVDALISAISITPERKEKYDLTIPYYKDQMSFFTTINKDIVASIEGLQGKRVGTIKGSVFFEYLKKNYPGAHIYVYPTSSEAIADLSKGKLDIILIDTLHAKWWLINVSNQFKIVGDSLPEGGGYAIAIKKGNPVFLQQLNTALQTIIDNGTGEKIIKMFLPFGG